MKPELKAPGANLLTLKYDKMLSSFAYNFNSGRYIKAQGVVVTVVDDGSVAVEKLVNEKVAFDLAFFDINMPIMGGVEALRQVRGLLRISTRLKLNMLLHPPHACMNIIPEGKTCSDPGSSVCSQ